MIVEIGKPRESCRSTLDYNESKVQRGVAELIATCNLEDARRKTVYDTFERFEKSRYPVREVSFHASVNPSETDQCSEDDVLDFIVALMNRLGLGSQPYLVYRHCDTGRIHYHVVSVRIDGNGRKINNAYEHRKASEFMASVAEVYHFTIPKRGEGVRNKDVETEDVGRQKRFNHRKADILEQMKEVASYALTYDFDGVAQFEFVMSSLGVRAEEVMGTSDPQFVLQGLDDKGRLCTKIIPESALECHLYEKVMTASIANKQSHHIRKREKERLKGLVKAAYDYSKSEAHFENILRNKGVTVHLSRTVEGEIFGITLVDSRTRCVFKASEMSDVISVSKFKEAVESGHWRAADKGQARGQYVKDQRRKAREEASTLRDINIGVIARVLKPVGQPKGNSWSGKSEKTEEQRREQYEEQRSGALNSNLQEHIN